MGEHYFPLVFWCLVDLQARPPPLPPHPTHSCVSIWIGAKIPERAFFCHLYYGVSSADNGPET